jgi:cytochrome c oxidase assembly protein subunit 15
MSRDAASRSEPVVGVWLLLICALVIAMIVVGGATRLTDSGLSITEWDLGKGLTPPLTDARWAEEFALYQRTVEYQSENRGMSLEQFQFIYWWEWGHRFVGKMIAAAFALPFALFWATGRLRGRFWPILGLFSLGALQGAIGWWMVTSGLFSAVNVSSVRLAIHLGVAFVILGLAFLLALDALGLPRKPSSTGAPRIAAYGLLSLLFVQILFGALLAGDRGGAAYQDWPRIGGEWIPASAFALDPFWRNFTENYAGEHFIHRTTGYLVAGLALALAAAAMWRGEGHGRFVGLALGAVALGQVALGIGVVLNAVPLGLSLIHQAGAVGLWLCATLYLRAATEYRYHNALYNNTKNAALDANSALP